MIDYIGTTAKSQFSYDGLGHRMVDVETASGGGTTTTRYLWCPKASTLNTSDEMIPGTKVGNHSIRTVQGIDFQRAMPSTAAFYKVPPSFGGVICQTRDGSDNVLRRDLDEGEYSVSTGQKLVYMPDQLRSVRDVLDATTGNLVQSYDYTPYGAIARSSGSTPTDFKYAKLFYHPISGLNLANFRAQDGVTGRWINRDPINEIGGINLYGYVGARTPMLTDPLGLQQCPPANDNEPDDGCKDRYEELLERWFWIKLAMATGLQNELTVYEYNQAVKRYRRDCLAAGHPDLPTIDL